jgi:serine/threonine protein kinase
MEEEITSKLDRLNCKEYDILFEEPLGKGLDSVVYPVKNQKFAVKRVMCNTSEKEMIIKQQLEKLPKLKYPGIVEVLGYDFERLADGTARYDLFMERGLQNLAQFQKSNPDYFENYDNTVDFIVQIWSAGDYLEQVNIPHRNVKPENILVFEGNVFKLSDISFYHEGYVKSTEYLSPEVLASLDEGVGDINFTRADLYSVGLIFLQVCGISPEVFNNLWSDDALREAIQQLKVKLGDNWLPKWIAQLLITDPAKRESFQELNHKLSDVLPMKYWDMYYTKTRTLYEKYANEGDAYAQREMGVIYSYGYESHPVDYIKAREWFQMSANQNFERALIDLHRFNNIKPY